MDTTIRNLDEEAYRSLKAWAALRNQSIGAALSDIIRLHTAELAPARKRGSLADLPVVDFGKRSSRLSEQVDAVVYGA